MVHFLESNEALVRAGFFLGILFILILAEILWPRRQRRFERKSRWLTNLSMVVIGMISVRVLSLMIGLLIPVAMAHYAESHGYGLFNQLPALSNVSKFIFSLVLLDVVIYWQHRLFHAIPILWRLHKVHHMDLELDVTSGNRFHPLEIIISILIKTLVVLIFGIPAASVIVFEIILNGMSQFNHANLSLGKADKFLRKVIVTPDFHITHHSNISSEMNKNFGFNLSLWDKLFNSYQKAPSKGYENLDMGLKEVTSAKETYLKNSLVTPFK